MDRTFVQTGWRGGSAEYQRQRVRLRMTAVSRPTGVPTRPFSIAFYENGQQDAVLWLPTGEVRTLNFENMRMWIAEQIAYDKEPRT